MQTTGRLEVLQHSAGHVFLATTHHISRMFKHTPVTFTLLLYHY